MMSDHVLKIDNYRGFFAAARGMVAQSVSDRSPLSLSVEEMNSFLFSFLHACLFPTPHTHTHTHTHTHIHNTLPSYFLSLLFMTLTSTPVSQAKPSCD